MSVWLTFTVPLANFRAATITILPMMRVGLKESVSRRQAEIMRPGFNCHSRFWVVCNISLDDNIFVRLTHVVGVYCLIGCKKRDPTQHKRTERVKEAVQVVLSYLSASTKCFFETQLRHSQLSLDLCEAFRGPQCYQCDRALKG